MATTITLDDDLFAELKRMAKGRGISTDELVAETLRRFLPRRRPARPVTVGGGLMPGVDLEDRRLIDLWG